MKLFFLLFSTTLLYAEDGLPAAQAALDAGFPQVAVKKLESAFPEIYQGKADPEAILTLARSLLAVGRTDATESLLRQGNDLGRGGDYWLAQSLATLGRWNEALNLYRACANDAKFSMAHESTVGEARMLSNLGHPGEAVQQLEQAFAWPESPARNVALLDLSEIESESQHLDAARAALDSMSALDSREKMRHDFLLARCLAQLGDDAGAIRLFSNVVPLNADMAVATVTGHAEALARTRDQLPAAETLLEEFIAAHPNIVGLEKVFAALDRVYAAESSASSNELKRWADDDDGSLRKKLASFYFARFEARQNHLERTVSLLDQAVRENHGEPLAREAALELAAVRLREGRASDALALLPNSGESPQADFLRGLALAANQKTTEAAAAFRLAASHSALAESALFNAAVCELLSGNTDNQAFATLTQKFPTSSKIDFFRLQKAFELARSRDPRTQDKLQELANEKNPLIAGPAALALAEWKYQQLDFTGARLELQRISTQPGVDPAREAALAVFLADTGDSGAEGPAISAAEKFLQEHAGSESETEVRLKLGELLFRKGDFAAARVQLELLARKFPDSPLEEPALFLAAQAAARSRSLVPTAFNDAMLLFEEVASMNGPLALRARFEQAILQNAESKPKEAIVILDRLLASQPDPDTKASALVEKGKTLYALGASDPASYHAAIAVWKQVADAPDSTPAWRNQALERMGAAFEKLGDNDAAVASYYDAIMTDQGRTPEFFWFYKAGFAAARLLESSKNWNEAIRVYEILSAGDGPRAEEARSRINKIRLENFLWNEP